MLKTENQSFKEKYAEVYKLFNLSRWMPYYDESPKKTNEFYSELLQDIEEETEEEIAENGCSSQLAPADSKSPAKKKPKKRVRFAHPISTSIEDPDDQIPEGYLSRKGLLMRYLLVYEKFIDDVQAFAKNKSVYNTLTRIAMSFIEARLNDIDEKVVERNLAVRKRYRDLKKHFSWHYVWELLHLRNIRYAIPISEYMEVEYVAVMSFKIKPDIGRWDVKMP